MLNCVFIYCVYCVLLHWLCLLRWFVMGSTALSVYWAFTHRESPIQLNRTDSINPNIKVYSVLKYRLGYSQSRAEQGAPLEMTRKLMS
jgi:hypothetical protein